ncbi:DUF397 domain-containing protein [Actinomadura oligospora]|uniref:DUF397 domain-containing protein n=1 Tax=Actinomadura oligospora TaxID=111804 RepID=UPI0004B57125|nr:DUF397 domain-containing protein [Actinomadura oligospora]
MNPLESSTPGDLSWRIEKIVWRKGSRCGANGGCVEIGALPAGLVGARDSHIGDAGPVLRLSSAEWRSVLADIRRGALDMPS